MPAKEFLLAAASLVAIAATGAIPPVDPTVEFPESDSVVTAKEWQLQPFEPEDARRVIKDVSFDDVPGDLSLDLDDTLDPSPANGKRNSAKGAGDGGADQPELVWPTDASPYWGWFRFASGAWWATTMLMHEANTLQFELPRTGMTHDQYGYNNVWLRTFQDIDPSWIGKRVFFSIGGLVGCDANLYVNRKLAGTLFRPEGELEISKFLEFGKRNELLLLVSANGYQIPPVARDTYLGKQKGGSYAGIVRRNFNITGQRPRLTCRPDMSITDVFANTSWRKKALFVEVEISGADNLRAPVLLAEVFDRDGRLVKSLSMPFKAGAGSDGVATVVGEIPWDDPITWEFGRGYLYTLRTAVVSGGRKFGYPDVRFGFREIWRDGRKIFMNGHEQKFRMCYNFGAGVPGAEFLSGLGYNVIQYAHNNRDIDPIYSEKLLYGLAERGIGCAIAAPQIFWSRRNALADNPDVRADYNALLAKNLRRYRNIPCVVMSYLGVNINIQNWTQEALHLGSGSEGKFDKLINSVAASAHETNPNALFYSHGDGINGDIATANLYFNWIPLQERIEWPSRWAMHGHFPFQASEFGHPYERTWYRKGHHDAVSELLAIYYGDEAYRKEPQSIRIRHGDKGLLYIRRMQHPLYWEFLREFVWGVNKSWRTFGINGGWVWFNLDQGFGMPGWELGKIWNEYGVNYTDKTFEKIGGVPEGRPDWAFPSWDIYQLGNKDFLGYIGGWPRHTDARRAYAQGEKVEKQIVMLDDSFSGGEHAAEWIATLGGRKIAGGTFKSTLRSNIPEFSKIEFAAPAVERRTAGTISAVFRNAAGKEIFADEVAFDVYPMSGGDAAPNPGARIVLYDPLGSAGRWLERQGVTGVREIDSLSPEALGDATHLVIGPYALGTNCLAVASKAIEAGLDILIMEQDAKAWSKMGFEVFDVAPRRLWLRDTSNPAFAGIDGATLRDWAGQPQVPPGARTHEGQFFGHFAKGGGPRWTRNMAVASLVLRTPDAVGFIPQIEGEFDMNMSALLLFRKGAGSIRFCTLSLTDRTLSFPPASPVSPDDVRPVRDPACDSVGRAILRDFLSPAPQEAAARSVQPLGAAARRLAAECRAPVADGPRTSAGKVLLVGPDAESGWTEIKKEIAGGAKAIIFANEKISREAGFAFGSPATNYCASFSAANKALRGIGQNLMRWRSMMLVRPYAMAPQGFALDADGLFASNADGNVIFTQIDPFQIETRLRDAPKGEGEGEEAATEAALPARGATPDDIQTNQITLDEEETVEQMREESQKEADSRKTRLHVASMTIEHGYQFFSRILSNLGAAPSPSADTAISGGNDGKNLYNLPLTTYNPYFFHYW